jgi:hypothetical protein
MLRSAAACLTARNTKSKASHANPTSVIRAQFSRTSIKCPSLGTPLMALPVSETGCTPLKHQHLSGLAGVLNIGYSISTLSPQYGKSQVQCMYIGYLLVNMQMNLRLQEIIIFRTYLASSKWSPKRRVAYIHVGEPSELGSL